MSQHRHVDPPRDALPPLPRGLEAAAAASTRVKVYNPADVALVVAVLKSGQVDLTCIMPRRDAALALRLVAKELDQQARAAGE